MFELPPLPDIFGNYSIKGIAELQSPATISWIPTTTAWKFLGVIAFCILFWRLSIAGRTWLKNRYRKAALEQLKGLVESHGYRPVLVPAVLRLLKATALQRYSRDEIAALSGESWVLWLNRQTSVPVFSAQSALLIAVGAYTKLPASEQASRQLVEEIADWIALHPGYSDA